MVSIDSVCTQLQSLDGELDKLASLAGKITDMLQGAALLANNTFNDHDKGGPEFNAAMQQLVITMGGLDSPLAQAHFSIQEHIRYLRK